MDKATALKALSLEPGASPEAIQAAYASKSALLQKRMDSSDNEAVKQNFASLLHNLTLARDTLLGAQPAPLAAVPASGVDIAADDVDIHAFLTAQDKSERRKRMTLIVLAGSLLLLGALWLTGSLQTWWEQYRPMSAEESVALAATQEMQTDVQARKQSLHAARIILSQRIVQAEEEGAGELPILQETLVLADKSVFMSPKRQSLEQREQEALAQLQQRRYFAAEKNYRAIQQDLVDLQATYEQVQVVPPTRAATRKVQEQWRVLQKAYSLQAPQEARHAEQLWAAAEAKKDREVYAESIADYEQAKAEFLAAQVAVADEVARRKARLAAAREARAKRWRKRLAWLKTITPTMVAIPAGQFTMGSTQADSDAQPEHKVSLAAFKLSQNEITRMRFAQFVKETGYVSEAGRNSDGLGCAVYSSDGSWGWRQGYHWNKVGFKQSERDPVVCISWNDAKAYADWLSKAWGDKRNFRLISEAEWEYAARAGGSGKYPMGDSQGNNQTVCDGCGSVWDVKRTAPAGSFALSPFQLHAMPGNVWEWTEDCWHDSYQGAPGTQQAWLDGGDCQRRVLRGGSWFNKPNYLTSAYRGSNKRNYRGNNLGFRLAETPVPGEKDYDQPGVE